MTPLRIGIIGASAGGGWARVAHVPAVQGLPGLELLAVATRSQVSADAAASAFGVARAYGDAHALIADPDIDVVTVAVSVPDHRDLVLAALQAGKHVYCEWPLSRDVADAGVLAEAAKIARRAGIYVALGLQAHRNPAVLRAQALIASGQLGRVLSARLFSGTASFGDKVGPRSVYMEDPANGATFLSIHGGHALDTADFVLGGLQDVTALTTIQFPWPQYETEGGTRRPRTIPDHLLSLSRLSGGGALSLEIAGGRPPESPFYLEVVGERGTLRLDGGAPSGFQSGRLRLTLDGAAQPLSEPETAALPDRAANVGAVYAALRGDILGDTWAVPDFGRGVEIHRLLEQVSLSAVTGSRSAVGE